MSREIFKDNGLLYCIDYDNGVYSITHDSGRFVKREFSPTDNIIQLEQDLEIELYNMLKEGLWKRKSSVILVKNILIVYTGLVSVKNVLLNGIMEI